MIWNSRIMIQILRLENAFFCFFEIHFWTKTDILFATIGQASHWAHLVVYCLGLLFVVVCFVFSSRVNAEGRRKKTNYYLPQIVISNCTRKKAKSLNKFTFLPLSVTARTRQIRPVYIHMKRGENASVPRNQQHCTNKLRPI